MFRKTSLRHACGGFAFWLAASMGLAAPAQAQKWPDQSITIVVGSGPGSAPDIIARLLADSLAKRLGTAFIVDNKPGATGAIGAANAARAAADANTLFMMTAVHTILPSITSDSQYDPVKSFAPVALVASVPLILVANKEMGVNSLKDVVAKARAKPESIYYGSPGNGSIQHFATALLAQKEDIKMIHVPYKSGGDAVAGLLGNQVQLFFAGMPPALPQIQAGKLTALAVSTEKRAAAAPQVPTLIDLGYPGMTADNWHALVAVAGSPKERTDRLAAEIAEVLKDEAIREKLLKIGGEANFKGPGDLGALIGGEVAKWKAVIPATGLQLK